MNRFLTAVAMVAFAVAPGIAAAQSDMKGSPNADGAGKERAMGSGTTPADATKSASEERPAATKNAPAAPNTQGHKE